jgi:hypothetical protein
MSHEFNDHSRDLSLIKIGTIIKHKVVPDAAVVVGWNDESFAIQAARLIPAPKRWHVVFSKSSSEGTTGKFRMYQ